MNKKMISLEISDELREAIRAEAYKKNKNLSAIIREVLEKRFAKELKEIQNTKTEK